MLDKETYNKEIVRMWDSVRDDKYKGRNNCEGVICRECQFCDINDNDCYEPINAVEMVEAVEKWSNEHPPKHKISQLEYDILCVALDYEFVGFDYYWLGDLLEKGYFKGATLNTDIVDYFNHCEVVDK